MSGAFEFNAAEAHVVSAWFKHGDVLSSSGSVVREELLSDERLRIVWRAVSALRDAKEPVTLFGVASWLGNARMLDAIGGVPYLIALSDYGATSVGYDRNVAAIANAAGKRRLRDVLATRLVALDEEPDLSAVDHAEALTAAILDVLRAQDTKTHGLTYAQIADLVMRDLTDAYANPASIDKTYLPTGIRALDQIIGGFEGSRTYCIGARPAVGKSAVLLACAHGLALNGHWSCLSSLEMSVKQVFRRSVSSKVGAPWRKIIRDQSMAPVAVNAVSECSALRIVVDDKAGASVSRILAWARAERAHGRCDALFVDYLQLVKGITSKGGTREQEVSTVSRGFKDLSRELDIPVVFASQLNRTAVGEKPHMGHLRESGSLEQDSDCVILLHTEADPADGAEVVDLDAIVDKNRDGHTGTAELTFYKSQMRLVDR
jgi:replicative DNA helicase